MPEKNEKLYNRAPNFFNLLGGEEKITFSETSTEVERLGMGKENEFHSGQKYIVYREDYPIGKFEVHSDPEMVAYSGTIDEVIFDYMKERKAKYERIGKIGKEFEVLYNENNGRRDGWTHIPFP